MEVTEQFLADALKYYKEKYGPYYQVGDYYICFEPLAIIRDFQKIEVQGAIAKKLKERE